MKIWGGGFSPLPLLSTPCPMLVWQCGLYPGLITLPELRVNAGKLRVNSYVSI